MIKELHENGQLKSRQLSEAKLKAQIDPDRLPQHVAVIMDGNGRWAKKRGLPRAAGHRAGIKSLRELTRCCSELGIKILTVYAFSTENWGRPREEVNFLLNLIDEMLERELQRLHENDVQIRIIGRRSTLPATLNAKMARSEELTANNKGLIFNVGFNYGGRAEIVDAVKWAVAAAKRGEIDEENVNESLLSQAMYTAGLPDPDLLIRTGGESRISNFLLWQCAYSELWITPVFWPDFRKIHLLQAICDYQARERRFGRL